MNKKSIYVFGDKVRVSGYPRPGVVLRQALVLDDLSEFVPALRETTLPDVPPRIPTSHGYEILFEEGEVRYVKELDIEGVWRDKFKATIEAVPISSVAADKLYYFVDCMNRPTREAFSALPRNTLVKVTIEEV